MGRCGGAHRGARDPLCSSLSKLHEAHDSARRAPANSSQTGHSRFAHAQEARTEMSHPQAETPHGYGGDDQARGHAPLAHAHTGAAPTAVGEPSWTFSSFRKGGRTVVVKLINCSGSASWKRAPFVLLFLHERASPWKNPREYGKKNLPCPFPLPAPSTRGWLRPHQWVLNAH